MLLLDPIEFNKDLDVPTLDPHLSRQKCQMSCDSTNGTHSLTLSTVETAYKVYVCPRGNLLYMRIYLIPDQNLLWKDILGF